MTEGKVVYLGPNLCSVLALPNVSSRLRFLETIRKNMFVIIDCSYNRSSGLMFLLNQNTKKVMEVVKEGESVSTGELRGPVMYIG